MQLKQFNKLNKQYSESWKQYLNKLKVLTVRYKPLNIMSIVFENEQEEGHQELYFQKRPLLSEPNSYF